MLPVPWSDPLISTRWNNPDPSSFSNAPCSPYRAALTLRVRAWRGVGGTPPFIERDGAHIFDADGNEYIDYIGPSGPLILGHRHPVVLDALNLAIARGTSFGAPTEQGEVELAETVRQMIPPSRWSVWSTPARKPPGALRVARDSPAATRPLSSRAATTAMSIPLRQGRFGRRHARTPDSPGVPKGFSDTTLAVPFNNTAAVEAAFEAHPGQIAAVIVEPVCGNMEAAFHRTPRFRRPPPHHRRPHHC